MAKYTEWISEEGLIKIGGWAKDGLTDEQIAQNIGISRSTLNEWKKRFPDIKDTIKRGKEVVDRQVENALFKSAVGYEYTEITKELTDSGMKVTKRVTKQVAPNPTSAIFWLKNRKPDEWRDKKETKVSGEMSVNNPFAGLSEEELRKLAEGDG
ncbi:helix-turn-helix domain-containing protein [Enterococcus faecalis]|nr:helix-turn-helix domain-containing protein [Enterococcus faecalis]EHQ8803383.1 helix-turn-helix domain-containing protein [Enterococcus faecalis]EJZ8457474.1 helix-turn-helix domain-containing protein [Enterococcus faecalis]ELS0384475.1 helix-turn-helix domain-containing protein [Enterococcus faecalis]